MIYYYIIICPFKSKFYLQDTDLEGLRTVNLADFVGFWLNIFNLN